MKRSLTITVLLAAMMMLPFITSAQRYNAWQLGANMGGTWQTSDIEDYAHIGWGATLTKWKHQNQTHFFDYGFRFRYLNGRTYGHDYRHSRGLQSNTIFNGSGDTTLNYAQDPGYIFHNYRMQYDEFSLEFLLGLNRLRERTGIMLYGWGGLGVAGWQTFTDQRGIGGAKYNYTGIDTTGNKAGVDDALDRLRDGEYETAAEGNASRNWSFSPSAGIGFGYQFTPTFSMALEYKTTFPRVDILDGQQWNNAGNKTATNDRYHYGGLHLLFSIGGGKPKEMVKTNENNYSNNNAVVNHNNNNQNVNPVVGGGNNQGTVVNSPKPDVRFINPSYQPYNSQQEALQVTAKVEHTNSAANVSIRFNGYSVNNFNYNGAAETVSFTVNLVPGSNTIEVRANNNMGSDSETMTVNYSNPNNFSSPPPVVTITYPNGNPFNSTQNNVAVNGTVINVTSKSQIAVSVNGSPVSNFNYDSYTKVVNFNASLVTGNNTVVISATTPAGSDSKFLNINYKADNPPVNAKPIVTILNPVHNPYNSPQSTVGITAKVENVQSKSNITVTLNNANVTAFDFDPVKKMLTMTANLVNGSNILTITAMNVAGTDSRSTTLMYKQVVAQRPAITITNPATNPFTYAVASATVNATVLNVSSSSEISVMLDGSPVKPFNYDMNTKQLTFTVALKPGSNNVMINASNTAGSDTKSTVLVYNQPGPSVQPPDVNITLKANPHTVTNPSYTLTATVTNVTKAKELEVTVNNAPVTNFTFGSGTLNLPLTLNEGSTVVVVKATNSAGTDSDTRTIIYAPVAAPIVQLMDPGVTNPRSGESITVTGRVYNVTNKNQLTVKHNGNVITNWTYNESNGRVTLSPVLLSGTNVFELKATTPGGTDSKTVTVVAPGPQSGNPQNITTPGSGSGKGNPKVTTKPKQDKPSKDNSGKGGSNTSNTKGTEQQTPSKDTNNTGKGGSTVAPANSGKGGSTVTTPANTGKGSTPKN